jgi:hypothetical protein
MLCMNLRSFGYVASGKFMTLNVGEGSALVELNAKTEKTGGGRHYCSYELCSVGI